jgi:hypothetical protein
MYYSYWVTSNGKLYVSCDGKKEYVCKLNWVGPKRKINILKINQKIPLQPKRLELRVHGGTIIITEDPFSGKLYAKRSLLLFYPNPK